MVKIIIQFHKYIYISVVFASLCFLGHKDALAQGVGGPSISVAPHTFERSVIKGEKIEDEIKVYNRGNFSIPFKIEIVDFGAIDETGEMTMLEKEGEEDSAVGWFEFEEESFVVDSGQKKNINFTIKVPNEAKSQGYYAIAMFEADISTYMLNESKLQVIPNMGVIFMLQVEGGESSLEPLSVLEYSVLDQHRMKKSEEALNFLAQPFVDQGQEMSVIGSEAPTFLVQVKNNDSYHKKLSGNIELSGVGWKIDGELGIKPITILPGMTRTFVVKGEMGTLEGKDSVNQEGSQKYKTGGFGLMQADLKIGESQGFSKQKRQWIVVFSWKLIVLLILLGSCLLILVVFARRKFLTRRAQKKKLGKNLKKQRIKKRQVPKEIVSEKVVTKKVPAKPTKKKPAKIAVRKPTKKKSKTDKTEKRKRKTKKVVKNRVATSGKKSAAKSNAKKAKRKKSPEKTTKRKPTKAAVRKPTKKKSKTEKPKRKTAAKKQTKKLTKKATVKKRRTAKKKTTQKKSPRTKTRNKTTKPGKNRVSTAKRKTVSKKLAQKKKRKQTKKSVSSKKGK